LRHDASRSFRVAASATLGFAEVDRTVETVFWGAIDRMRREHEVIEAAPSIPDGFQEAYETIRGATLHEEFEPLIAQHAARVTPTLQWNVARGAQTTALQLLRAERLRMRFYSDLIGFLDRYDCIATLSAPIAAFPISQREVLSINGRELRNIIDYSAVALIGTMTGFPCLSIPCGMTPDGLPVGMQLIAAPSRQTDLLILASQLEARSSFVYQPPPLGVAA